MNDPISGIAFTAAVKAAQEEQGSRASYARMEQRGDPGPWDDVVTPELAEFIEERDSLYLGTAGADGQPYIQYRGGPKGFLKVLDKHTLALAEFSGNAQYISLGNLNENDKAFIFLMDYANRRRIKSGVPPNSSRMTRNCYRPLSTLITRHDRSVSCASTSRHGVPTACNTSDNGSPSMRWHPRSKNFSSALRIWKKQMPP